MGRLSYSILFRHPLAAVGRVADQRATLRIHHEIELLQRHLADQDRNIVSHFHHVELASAVLNRILHGPIGVGLDNSCAGPDPPVSTFLSPSWRIMRVGSDK